MDIVNILRRFLRRNKALEAIDQALESNNQSLQSPIEALKQKNQSIEALQAQQMLEKRIENESIDFKEPFQLGLAAGYTGRSIREIESSLFRIESQMITKDWFTSNFNDKILELIRLMQLHEDEEKKRFEAITNILLKMHSAAERAPEPLKSELLSYVTAMEEQLPLTQKMQGLLLVVKEYGEISYQDLALKLGISVSGLRGLLTHTLRRTNKIERYVKNGKGWVRYKSD